jgi:hypothetical protein
MSRMSDEKKITDWIKHGLDLEVRGLTLGTIGSELRLERLKTWRRKARFYRNIVVHAGKCNLKITIVEKPELAGDHVTLGMILELPLDGNSQVLSYKAGSAFKAFLKNAVGGARKSGRHRSVRRPRSSRRVKPA